MPPALKVCALIGYMLVGLCLLNHAPDFIRASILNFIYFLRPGDAP